MKHPLLSFLLVAGLVPVPSLQAQTIEVANWRGDMAGAVSLTFDDSPANHWTNAEPIMTAAGVRGTFCVITNSVDWNGARAAALNGHEIGSHSTDGNALDVLTFAEAAARMQQSHDAIETEIGSAIAGYRCHVIAWPFGKRRLDVVNDPAYKDLYVSARNAGNTLLAGNSVNSGDTTLWWKYGEGTYGLDHYFVIGDALMGAGITLSTFNQQLDKVESEDAWTVFTYHSIVDSGASGLSVNKADFTDQMNALASRLGSTIWAAPYGEVARYIRERDDATATVTGNTGNTITISLTDGLDDAVYDVPLTLLFDAPAGWISAFGTQGGNPIDVEITGGKVLFEAVPDAGTISISDASAPEPDPPTVAMARLDAGTFQLSWDTETGIQYEVKTSMDLSTWQSMDPPIVVPGDDLRHEQAVPYTGPLQFFQVEATFDL